MKIYSHNIQDNKLALEFGYNALNRNNFKNDINTKSFHLAWEGLPSNTQSLALIFQDYDAIEVCGFCWIHWTVVNINPNLNELIEDASNLLKDEIVQGKNSWASKLVSNDYTNPLYETYGGCAPPNKDHQYEITLYALDKKLDLINGFYMNEMMHQMEGHILDKTTIKFWYPKVK